MSLILEALKKLEREKRSSEPGFLVLGPTSWPSAVSGARRAAVALGGLAILATALGLLAWRNAARLPPARTPAATTPSPAAPSDMTVRMQASSSIHIAAASPAPEAKPAVPKSPATEPMGSGRPEDTAKVETVREPAPPLARAPQSAQSPEAPRPRFRLQAISRRDGRPVAVLNDRLVYEGESFDGVSVVRIGEAEIELEVDGRRVVIGF